MWFPQWHLLLPTSSDLDIPVRLNPLMRLYGAGEH